MDGRMVSDYAILESSRTKAENTIKIMEELSELQKAVSKAFEYGLTETTKANLLEEMADALICFEILTEMYRIKPEELEQEMEKKMERNMERLSKRKKEKNSALCVLDELEDEAHSLKAEANGYYRAGIELAIKITKRVFELDEYKKES